MLKPSYVLLLVTAIISMSSIFVYSMNGKRLYTHHAGGWVGPRAGLDKVVDRKVVK
jgi:hypothetical protein